MNLCEEKKNTKVRILSSIVNQCTKKATKHLLQWMKQIHCRLLVYLLFLLGDRSEHYYYKAILSQCTVVLMLRKAEKIQLYFCNEITYNACNLNNCTVLVMVTCLYCNS